MYSKYKPLRNYLRAFPLFESLEIVHAYFQFMQFSVPLPKPLGHWRMMLKNAVPGHGVGMYEWELETLTREIILNCPNVGSKSFRQWENFSTAMNHIKRIENDAWGENDLDDGIWRELHRIAHRQFGWQRKINHGRVIRYFKIFNDERVSPLVEQATGLKTPQLFSVGMALTGHYLKAFEISEPIRDEINGLPPVTIEQGLQNFVCSIDGLRTETIALQDYSINWAYTFNPLRRTPLIRLPSPIGSSLICPVPRLLLERITDGIYYEIRGLNGFANAFGSAFQDYVGAVLNTANRSERLAVTTEHFYGRKGARKATSDWIVDDNDATIFVECKTKRMRIEAKFDLSSEDFFSMEIANMAGFLAQLYRTLADAKAGAYEDWTPRGDKIFPIVITLENWYAFGNYLIDKVHEKTKEIMKSIGLSSDIVELHPFTICGVEDLELTMQVIDKVGIAAVFDKKFEGERRYWDLSTVVEKAFPAEAKAAGLLFPEEWERMTPPIAG